VATAADLAGAADAAPARTDARVWIAASERRGAVEVRVGARIGADHRAAVDRHPLGIDTRSGRRALEIGAAILVEACKRHDDDELLATSGNEGRAATRHDAPRRVEGALVSGFGDSGHHLD